MKRDIDRLAQQTFDLLIIGSGIYGAFLAREAAMRGLSVAIIDKSDFGAGTSANSLKVIHGGLRYLQHLDWTRMRESIRARRQLLAIAPYLVRGKRFIVPTSGHGLQGRWVMRLALLLNDIVSIDRNQGLGSDQRIDHGQVVSRRRMSEIVPGIDPHGLTGGAMWMDGFVENTERLMMAVLHSAVEVGAVAANYVACDRYRIQESRVQGVEAIDQLSGRRISIDARMTINAAGPGAAPLDTSSMDAVETSGIQWVKAFNIFIRRPLLNEDIAAGLSTKGHGTDDDALIDKGGRFYFFVPWKNGTLIGTEYVPADTVDADGLTEPELTAFIEQLNQVYPAAGIRRDEIGFCHVGLLPANHVHPSGDASAGLLKQTRIIDHGMQTGLAGLLTVIGIKYTVAPQVAIEVIDRIAKKMGIHAHRPDVEPALYGGESGFTETGAHAERLYQRYGSRYRDVLTLAEQDPDLAAIVDHESGTTAAEVVHAVREEMAVGLADVVYRRTAAGSRGVPPQSVLKTCADIMARELGWSSQQLEQEMQAASDPGRYCRGQGPAGGRQT